MKKGSIAHKAPDVSPRRIDGTPDDDYLQGLQGGDFIHGHGGNDQIGGGDGSDRLIGGVGNDELYGQRDQDRLFGGKGYDYLVGGSHKDILTGGPDTDVFRFFALPGSGGGSHLDIITDFDTSDPFEYVWLTVEPELGITEFSQLRKMMVQDGNDVVLSFGGVDLLVFENVRIRQLKEGHFFIEQYEEAPADLF